jgi:hypothetical protein
MSQKLSPLHREHSDSFDDRRICALPRLKNNKAIGVADVDTPEERGWQQSVTIALGTSFAAASVTKDIL